MSRQATDSQARTESQIREGYPNLDDHPEVKEWVETNRIQPPNNLREFKAILKNYQEEKYQKETWGDQKRTQGR